MITDKQIEELNKDFPRDWVKKRKAGRDEVSYVEGWRVIDRANQIFGFDGWSFEVVEQQLVSERAVEKKGDRGTYTNLVVMVRAKVRVYALGVHREDVGFCVGQASESNADAAHDMAWKGSVTDALKRALRLFGNQFGLALYDKDLEHVGASLDAQALLAEASALPEDASGLKVWFDEHRGEIDVLANDEKQAIFGVLNAKKAKLAIASFEKAIADAKNMAALQAVYDKVASANLDRVATDRLVAVCKARKTQLQRAEAAQGAH